MMNKKYMAVLVLAVATCSVANAGPKSWYYKKRNDPVGYQKVLEKELKTATSNVVKKNQEMLDEIEVTKKMNEMLTKLASELATAASQSFAPCLGPYG